MVMNGFMRYVPELGREWGLIIIVTIVVIGIGIYLRIRKNSRT